MIVTLRVTPRWAAYCLSAVEDFFVSRRVWLRRAGLWLRAGVAAAAGLAIGSATFADGPVPKLKPDPRVARLERFFRIYHCAEPYPTWDYLRAADGFGLDYRLLPAVSIRETSCGLADTPKNNLWGYRSGRQQFPSVAAGIQFMAKRLSEHPFYKGKTLRQKLYTYNPRPAYPGEVQRIMRQIE